MEGLENRWTPSATLPGQPLPDVAGGVGIFATGADAGSAPTVRVFDAHTATQRFSFTAFDASYTGGVRVAIGDVNHDGIDDVIVGAATGNPQVKVYDGKALALGTFNPANPDASLVTSFFAYGVNFGVGVNAAAADVNGDGYADIITGASAGNPHVKVFDGKAIAAGSFGGNPDDHVLASFFAYDLNADLGVNVAGGDVNGDAKADIITGPGPGGGLNVKVFSGADGALLNAFVAYDSNFTGGVNVAAGGMNGDGRADIITGAGAGGGPNVKVFSGTDDSLLQSFMAYDPSFTGGVRVAVGDANGDGRPDLITRGGGESHVKIFSGADDSLLQSFVVPGDNSSGGSGSTQTGKPGTPPENNNIADPGLPLGVPL